MCTRRPFLTCSPGRLDAPVGGSGSPRPCHPSREGGRRQSPTRGQSPALPPHPNPGPRPTSRASPAGDHGVLQRRNLPGPRRLQPLLQDARKQNIGGGSPRGLPTPPPPREGQRHHGTCTCTGTRGPRRREARAAPCEPGLGVHPPDTHIHTHAGAHRHTHVNPRTPGRAQVPLEFSTLEPPKAGAGVGKMSHARPGCGAWCRGHWGTWGLAWG